MTSRYDISVAIDRLTPDQAWEGFVGSQSTTEFMRLSPGMTPTQSCRQYVAESPVCADLTSDDRRRVAELLAAHIAKNATR